MPKNEPPRTLEPLQPSVAVLRWPDQDDERRRLAALGRPRVLLTEADVIPPSLLDDREVWIPEGRDATSVREAIERLDRTAALAPGRPLLDSDGLLRHGGRWVEIPASQLGVVTLLVTNYQRVVSADAIRDAYSRAAKSTTRASLGGLVRRLGERFARVELVLHRIHGRGLMLGPTPVPLATDLTTHEPA